MGRSTRVDPKGKQQKRVALVETWRKALDSIMNIYIVSKTCCKVGLIGHGRSLRHLRVLIWFKTWPSNDSCDLGGHLIYEHHAPGPMSIFAPDLGVFYFSFRWYYFHLMGNFFYVSACFFSLFSPTRFFGKLTLTSSSRFSQTGFCKNVAWHELTLLKMAYDGVAQARPSTEWLDSGRRPARPKRGEAQQQLKSFFRPNSSGGGVPCEDKRGCARCAFFLRICSGFNILGVRNKERCHFRSPCHHGHVLSIWYADSF